MDPFGGVLKQALFGGVIKGESSGIWSADCVLFGVLILLDMVVASLFAGVAVTVLVPRCFVVVLFDGGVVWVVLILAWRVTSSVVVYSLVGSLLVRSFGRLSNLTGIIMLMLCRLKYAKSVVLR